MALFRYLDTPGGPQTYQYISRPDIKKNDFAPDVSSEP
jgi:hypothetical protein